MSNIVTDINQILHKYGIHTIITEQDLSVTDKTVSDIAKPTARLSDAITDHLWPTVSVARVYHYTSREAAESILSTGLFRLTNIENRYGEGEIETFCKTHDLRGYLELDSSGSPCYKALLMPQTFYASFTDSNLGTSDEEYFWRTFAQSDGVRLTLDIKANNPNFRKILYEPTPGKPIPVLAELTTTIRQKHGREFVLQGISRLCAFYLCGRTYGKEKEYRALYKTWPECGPQPVGVGPTSYLDVPLDRMAESGYLLQVREVVANSRPKMPGHYTFIQRPASL